MTITEKYALLLSSLSVYRGVLQHSVPGAYHRLLCAHSANPHDFVKAWGRFFSLLCDKGAADDVCGCITRTVLFDENAFSKAAVQKKNTCFQKSCSTPLRATWTALYVQACFRLN